MRTTRGFTGQPRSAEDAVPPGQYVTDGFPVLTAGATPHVAHRAWELVVTDGATEKTYTWASLRELGLTDLTTDIHCVTRWSKLATTWQGVPVAALLEDAGVSDEPYALASCYGGYTTNLLVEDLVDHDAMVATSFEGAPIPAEHGGPVRLLVPHLYLWKSAKWLREIRVGPEDELGFWEQAGYHHRGDPWLEQRYYGD
jgi:DMSO/TMAO reductase YedYZ molybdopterin-dependent catalytic subunit